MNPLPVSNLPLIFHLVDITEVENNLNIKGETVDCIKLDFYQTPSFTPEIFYKPISKIWHYDENRNE
jgi:hypothetical protein